MENLVASIYYDFKAVAFEFKSEACNLISWQTHVSHHISQIQNCHCSKHNYVQLLDFKLTAFQIQIVLISPIYKGNVK